jgi:dienelactone hydrolase
MADQPNSHSPARRTRRGLDLAAALLFSLTLLAAGWMALIWYDPRLPVNPFPPPPEGEGAPGTTPVARASWRLGQPTPTYPPTWTPTATGTATPTRLPTSTPLPTNTPTATATPYPLRGYTILGMRGRPYAGSRIELQGTYGRSVEFTSHLFFYRSDGLRISGLMNVPQGEGPFPVVILCHGYVHPDKYATGNGTWRQADYLAQHGYLTLAPDYRNHAASDNARSFLHIGYAEDVLHLIASLPSLDKADARRVGLWGHSMGGAIALKAAVVSRAADAVVLFGSVSGDERMNHENGLGNGAGVYGVSLLGTPRSNPLLYKRMSPIHYLRYSPPLSIHHGQADGSVPYEWSEQLYAAAVEQGTPAELYLYPEGEHTLLGDDWQLAMERTLAFYDQHVK